MLKIEIRTLLGSILATAGVDGLLVVQEQPLSAAFRYSAALDGDVSFVGEGATPHEAIEDYTRKIATKGTTLKNPGGDITVTLSADGDGATIEIKK